MEITVQTQRSKSWITGWPAEINRADVLLQASQGTKISSPNADTQAALHAAIVLAGVDADTLLLPWGAPVAPFDGLFLLNSDGLIPFGVTNALTRVGHNESGFNTENFSLSSDKGFEQNVNFQPDMAMLLTSGETANSPQIQAFLGADGNVVMQPSGYISRSVPSTDVGGGEEGSPRAIVRLASILVDPVTVGYPQKIFEVTDFKALALLNDSGLRSVVGVQPNYTYLPGRRSTIGAITQDFNLQVFQDMLLTLRVDDGVLANDGNTNPLYLVYANRRLETTSDSGEDTLTSTNVGDPFTPTFPVSFIRLDNMSSVAGGIINTGIFVTDELATAAYGGNPSNPITEAKGAQCLAVKNMTSSSFILSR